MFTMSESHQRITWVCRFSSKIPHLIILYLELSGIDLQKQMQFYDLTSVDFESAHKLSKY